MLISLYNSIYEHKHLSASLKMVASVNFLGGGISEKCVGVSVRSREKFTAYIVENCVFSLSPFILAHILARILI